MSLEELDGYIAELRALRAEASGFIDATDAAALNWAPPAADTNTLYQLLTHMMRSEAWWIHQIVGGVDIGRDRPAEFRAAGDDAAALKARYEAVARQTEAVLRGLPFAALGEMRDTSHDRQSVRWCIVHVIEHAARHTGHMELTSQLYQAQARKPA